METSLLNIVGLTVDIDGHRLLHEQRSRSHHSRHVALIGRGTPGSVLHPSGRTFVYKVQRMFFDTGTSPTGF